jgi:phosphate transport system substrate-binding protein
MKKNKLFLALVGLLVLALLVGCSCGQEATPTEEAAKPTEKVEPTEDTSSGGDSLSLAGSTTVQPLAEALAAAYAADVNIEVSGGGSSTGVKSAGEGTADIGMASRKVKDSEMDEFPDIVVHTIAKDGIAIVVHPDVGVDGLTLDQAQAVFAGEITNWSELGGADAPITVISREEGSGTRGAFEEMVMGKEGPPIAEAALLFPSNGAVRTAVSTTPDSIAYLSFGYLDDSVKALAVDGVEATVANAIGGTFPIVRPLNMITKGEATGAAKGFLDFIMSDEGQAIVVDEGYLPVAGPAAEAPAEEEMSGEIALAGSTTVQPLAEQAAAAFTEMHPGVKVDVSGGGSSTGVKSAGEGTTDIGMASRKIKESELDEFPNLKIHTIAQDGIAIVVHPDVGVDGLTLDQARAIFAGEITNWSEVGGDDKAIVVISREEGSGTRGAFEEMVMGKEGPPIAEAALLFPSNGAVRTAVSTTPDAIAYLSFGYLDDSVKALAIDGVDATVDNALNGTYPVVRPLNMLTDGDPDDLEQAFLDWVFSADGQAMVEDEGYLPVK